MSTNITITLPSSPSTGDQYLIKDVDGYASQYSITIFGNGSNIDGSANFVLAQSFASISLTYTGSQWSVVFLYAGSGNGNSFGSFANRPIQGQSGRTYFANDTGLMYFDDGNTWNPMGQVDYCTALKSSDFTWQNQSGAVAADFGTGIFITTPPGSIRLLYKNVPSTPYTITAKFVHLGTMASGQIMTYGLGWSDGTKLITAHVNDNGNAWNTNMAYWDNSSTFNSEPFTNNFADLNDRLEWIRIADDGSNKSFSVSRDSVNFTTLCSVSSSAFLTATRVGIVIGAAASVNGYTSIMSWNQS